MLRASLLDEIKEDDMRRANAGATSARLKSLMASLRNAPEYLIEYDDAFIREHVESVQVIDADTLLVVFNGGIEVETDIRV